LNGEQQVENCWQIDAVVQCNPIVTTSQDFAGTLTATAKAANNGAGAVGELTISGTKILNPDGTEFIGRGWNWGRWGMFQPQDATDAKAQGSNIVRIPLRWFGLYGQITNDSRDDTQTATAGIDAQHLAILDSMVIGAFNAGLRVLLFIDSNCGQDGTQD